jgi:hypothetical protein
MDNYKFELTRADEAQQIMYTYSAKATAMTAYELVCAFVDFTKGCGFFEESMYNALALYVEEHSTDAI